jgi:hypothetical protein
MPTVQADPRAVSRRNGALSPYPASLAHTQSARWPRSRGQSQQKAISGLDRGGRYSTGTRARFNRCTLLVQLSGRKRRNATITGTSPRASISDTSVWQLPFGPASNEMPGLLRCGLAIPAATGSPKAATIGIVVVSFATCKISSSHALRTRRL